MTHPSEREYGPVKQITKIGHFMRNGLFILFSFFASLSISCNPVAELDQKIETVDTQLEKLPKLQPYTLCPTVGFGSAIYPRPTQSSWLDIFLPEPREIETIVLIPALLKNNTGELETLGFPHRFTIEAWQDPSPAGQSVQLKNGSWIYQAIGVYDPTIHPDELITQLTLNQSRFGSSSAPVSTSLYYSKSFKPKDGLDVHNAPKVVQIGDTQQFKAWSDWAAGSDKQEPHTVRSSFDLNGVPSGVTLYLRISAYRHRSNATIDEVRVNAPFSLKNGDFETPKVPNNAVYQDVFGWQDTSTEWKAFQQSTYVSGANYFSGGIIVDYSETDYPNPGAAPVVFKLPKRVVAEKVRIRSVRMQEEASWRKDKNGHNFAINEVLLFDGEENVALNAQTAASDHENFPLMFDSNYAVDGYSYFPPVDPKQVSRPHAELLEDADDARKMLFDLGQSYSLDQVAFYPVDRSPQFSHIYAMGIGFPRKITLQISDQPNPNTVSASIDINTLQQIGASPLTRRLSNFSGRYIWIEMDEGQRDPRTDKDALGFSEIQLFNKGSNVLLGKQPITPSTEEYEHLTDGLTSSGIIIPEKKWLLDLARRADLENEKIELGHSKEVLAARQSRLLKLLQASILIILIATIVVTLIARSRHRQHLRQLRETIGANLHDEVGANLSSIALSSEILSHSDRLEASKASRMIADIHRIASETATEIRLLSRFLERQDVESNLIGQLRRIQNQMLPNLQTRSEYGAPDLFNALTPIEKWELVLFFKETLHNIVKHSHATEVEIRTYSINRRLNLEISDNGYGLKDGSPAPSHLVKRAKRLKAELSIDSAKANGTNIKLSIPQKRRLKK